MLDFPNCKINLGLNVTEKRPDGYHNIETVFYPVKWQDALEIVIGGNSHFDLKISGLKVDGNPDENIIFKAYKLLSQQHKLPNLQVYLHKVLPMGAGLGGGSSDAAFFLKMTNKQLKLNLSNEQLTDMARQLGADCAFFIRNAPVFAKGKGDEFEPINVDLSQYHILVVSPGINCNTKEAYEGVVPIKPSRSVKDIVTKEPIENWKNVLVNDFEKSILKKYPEIEKLKNTLYQNGAIYASLSGSGSAVFGIFKTKPEINFPENYLWHLQEANELS
ncbi:MAG TPA: 4-(cytidine 5'-diphospho)-2-C-methyl-D-erythritol kinase [Bacteroidia bacterium]|jgi:4-diphosphocytidyl-2-C-methyl-D-erythritol kinase|nr:4-(cytidine 5'-diphospho)-2-C-methyl-D-erythritol kinase [Bacteroidia bacterium]